MHSSNSGKIVVITGGAHGLGQAIAKRFATEGFKVCILDIDLAAADGVAKDLQGQGREAVAIHVDVTDVNSIQEAFDRCVKEYSRIDVLVCCAGVSSVSSYLEVSESDWDRIFAINTRGLFFSNQRGARIMSKNGGGRIINISSAAVYMGLPYHTPYAASKASVDSITRSGAIALADKNIRVNCIAPGPVNTRLVEGGERAWAALMGVDYEQLKESRTRSLPLKRRATAEEIAEAVLFLARSASEYMTGSRLNFTGGLELC